MSYSRSSDGRRNCFMVLVYDERRRWAMSACSQGLLQKSATAESMKFVRARTFTRFGPATEGPAFSVNAWEFHKLLIASVSRKFSTPGRPVRLRVAVALVYEYGFTL